MLISNLDRGEPDSFDVVRTAEELLGTVRRSPEAVAAGDRSAWVNLYARNGVVNDPVGSRPHQGKDAIERFYDTFIAPNTIHFHPEHDVVCGMSVVRDLSLETIMSTGATLNVSMHVRYDLVDESGELKIARLAAHWELATMIGQLLRAGAPGLMASAKLTPQLVGNQGISGAIGFMGGLRGVGRRGKKAASDILSAASRGDRVPVPVDDIVKGATFRKFISAGRTVSASVEFESGHGVIFVDFSPRSLDIDSVTVFSNRPDI